MLENQTQDIDHEVIDSHDSPGIRPKIETVDDEIKHQVQKFNLADAAIQALNEKYGPLAITGPDDKAGYQAVKKAWNEVRTYRTGVEKKKKDIKADYIKIGKAIDQEEARLVSLLTPLEEDLYKKWKAIDEAKDAENRRKEQEEHERLMGRVNELLRNGMKLEDGFYQIGGTISADVSTLRAMPDEKYATFLKAVQDKDAQLKQIEAERLDKERKEREDFERQQRELKQQQEEMERQQREMHAQQQELQRQKLEMREHALRSMGMKKIAGDWIYSNGFNEVIHPAEPLYALDDYGFQKHREVLETEIKEKAAAWEEHKIEVEKKRKEVEDKGVFVDQAMEAIGMSYKVHAGLFVWSNDFDSITINRAMLMDMDGPAIVNKATEFGRRIMAAGEKQAQHAQEMERKAEEERQAGMKDKDKWNGYLSKLKAVPPPTFKSKKYTQRVTDFGHRFQNLITEFSDDTTANKQ